MSNQQPPSHRSLTGFVTKLVGDGATYGFINDEVFFPQTNVADGPASVGDQVFAECEYSAHLPIKWNASSVKIINKAGGQHQVNNSGADLQQKELMNQQYNPGNPVAVTYQQHRQQRQQRQMMDVNPSDNNIKQQQPQQNVELTTRLLDHNTNSGEFFGTNNARQFPQQQQQQQPDSHIQPFQDQPMGPPNFTYTSQLGSAFVQNQFVPAPFMAQQPPPMLPQQQQQHLLPSNQMHNQNNQRHNNQHNKGMGGGRFNNHGEKNERQNNRRNQNRNDNKFDRPRSGDRDGAQNNRASSKTNDNRDRSIGRNNKRDDIPVRPSPPPHSSARSATSVSSDRVTKSRRHYEVQNIPKIQIMTNMNAYNMKQRCPSSIHIPSDLKDITVNKYFRLDMKNTPKPIKFTIETKNDVIKASEESSSTSAMEQKDPITTSEEPPKKEDGEEVKVADVQNIDQDTIDDSSKTVSEIEKEEKSEPKSIEHIALPSSKSDLKLNHKYGVKVILISLPELDTIYQNVFGSSLDSFTTDSKSYSRLDEVISLLCNKGSNNGYSLIGGKFDPVLDGFIEGEINEFERYGRQPDLIGACKRLVMEQTGLDLGRCKSWTLLSTFMYNNKSDYFSSKASIEYSFIYMPQLWTMLSDDFDKNIMDREPLNPTAPINTQEMESSESAEMEVQESSLPLSRTDDTVDHQDDSNNPSSSTPNEAVPSSVILDNLSDLKVTDLKAELDRRNVQYKSGAKKAELISLLQECLQSSQTENKSEQEDVAPAVKVDEKSQLEEGEVEADISEDSPNVENDDATPTESESTSKRKSNEVETDDPVSKKICTQSPIKEKRVELIQKSFLVHARDEQQQLSLVSLYEAAQASRYDQFELSVASNILKESLVQHLSEYILTTLVEDNRQKMPQAGKSGTSSNSNSQETSSDTNNNSTKSTFKSPTSSSEHKQINLKELPVDRYVNLAFTYFDSSHMGYIYFEDLNKLFNNTGLTISKRALMSLIGDGEKFNYRTLPDLSPKSPPTHIYEFPEQFRRLPGNSSLLSDNESNPTKAVKMIEYKGVTYDVEKLIQQVRDAETLRVNLVDRFNYAIENFDKQAEDIHVLEVSQKSLAKAIKAQNDEICDLKRERDSIKKKYDGIRKGIKGTITSLTDLIKDDK